MSTAVAATPDPEEQAELEAAEAARLSSGSWDAVAPGKAQNFGKSFGRFIGLLRPHLFAVILVGLLGAISVVLAVIAPRVLGAATNVVFEGALSARLVDAFPAGTDRAAVVAALQSSGEGDLANMVQAMDGFTVGAGIDFDRLSTIIAWALMIYVGASILDFLQGYIINVVIVRAMFNLRQSVEEKINRLPLSYFDRVQRGELISRVTNDVDNMTQALQQALSGAIVAVLTVIGVLVMMFSISWQLALVALIALPLTAVITMIIGPKSQQAFQVQWRKVGRVNTRVEESFSGHALVKVFGQEAAMNDAFKRENDDLYDASFKAQFLSGTIMPSMMFVGSLSYVGIAVLGGAMVASGQLRIGDVQAFVQYSQQFTQPLTELGGMVPMVQSGTASAERVFELLDEEEQSPDADDAEQLTADGEGVIEFEHVAFSYAPDQPLIRDLSFRVEPGQTVAIVGPTGAGKTTLVNLVMRFYELDGGAIKLDGVDIANLTRDDVRSRTGMVLQDPWLFAGTITENIRYGRADASDEDVLAAAKATYVDRFAQSLPDGYDTVLDEDAANVSAGERQLITIARAFIRKPDVLILDEATSSVDTRTEVHVQRAMAALREGRTSFVIAHRLSTIRDADLILVMEHGDIVEQGTHDELIAVKGAYYRLYQSQFEHATVDLDAAEAMATGAVPAVKGSVPTSTGAVSTPARSAEAAPTETSPDEPGSEAPRA